MRSTAQFIEKLKVRTRNRKITNKKQKIISNEIPYKTIVSEMGIFVFRIDIHIARAHDSFDEDKIGKIKL